MNRLSVSGAQTSFWAYAALVGASISVILLIYTGARCGEIEGLRWEWVQPPRLMLPDSKTGAKNIYLNSQAVAVLDAMPAHGATGLVFRDPRSDQSVQLGMIWPRIRQHAALPDVRLHDLRHIGC